MSEASLLGDQRAILEEFFQVLYDRGVRIATTEQGRALGNAVADLYHAMQGETESGADAEEPADVLESLEPAGIRDWDLAPR